MQPQVCTTPSSPLSYDGPSAATGVSGESTVESMFCALTELVPGSPEFCRGRERIIKRCLPLADHIALRFAGRSEPHDDLVQVARVGLVNAVTRFDFAAGSDFVAFAVPTIMGEIRRHFRDNSWSLKVPRRYKDLYPKLGATTSELSQRLGRAPTASDLADELGIDRREVIEAMAAANSYKTLSIEGGGGHRDVTAIVSNLGGADDCLDEIENRELLRPLLASLSEREQTVVRLRFFDALTQSQIAEKIGVSQTHVSRLITRSLARMRDQLVE